MKIQTFIVGGYVRDSLLDIPSSDIDYVIVGHSLESYQKQHPNHKLVGKSFPVFLDENNCEVALARTERSIGLKHTDFTVETKNVTLKEDLYRRDLTINSLAFDMETNTIIDYCNGQKDLQNKILRHTSEHFKEDPLRVLRLARLQCKYKDFTIALETKDLIKTMKKSLTTLTKERVTLEVMKVLKLPNSRVFFDTLKDLGVLKTIFPDIYLLTKCVEDSPYHQERSVYEHTMMVIENLTVPVLKLAALFHDIAKPALYLSKGNAYGHEDHPMIEKSIQDSLQLDNLTFKTILLLIHNHIKIFKLEELKASTLLKFLEQFNYNTFKSLVELSIADATGRITESIKTSLTDARLQEYVILIEQLHSYTPKKYLDTLEKYPNGEVIKQYVHREKLNIIKQFRSIDDS